MQLAKAQFPWQHDVGALMRAAQSANTKAIELDPYDPICNIAVARAAFLDGDEEQARSEFLEAIINSPSNAMAHSILARLESYAGDAPRARALLERLDLLSPLESGFHFNIGTLVLCDLATGDTDRALADARNLAHRDINVPQTLAIVLAAFAQSGQDAEARQTAAGLSARFPELNAAALVGTLPTLSADMRDLLEQSLVKFGL